MFARAVRGSVSAVVIALAITAPAAAHTDLVSSKPTDGAVLTSAPKQVSLRFGEPLLDAGFRLALTDPQGTRQELSATVDAEVLSAPLPTAEPGRYKLAYRAVASDGHPLQGSITFRVKTAETAAAAASPAPADPAPQPTGERSAFNVALPLLFVALLAGVGFFLWRSRAD